MRGLERQRVQGTHPGGSELSTNPGLSPWMPALTPRAAGEAPHPLLSLGAVPSFGSQAQQILSMGCLVWRHQQLLLQVPLPAQLPWVMRSDAWHGAHRALPLGSLGESFAGMCCAAAQPFHAHKPKEPVPALELQRTGKKKKRRDVDGGQVVRQLQRGAWIPAGIPGIPPGI